MKPGRVVNWDKVGGAASTLCAVHCVLTGLAMGLISAYGLEFIASDALEVAFFAVAIVAGLFAVRSGLRKHGDWRLAILFGLGMVTLIGRHVLFGHPHSHAGDGLEEVPIAATWLSIFGATMLIVFHVVNAIRSHKGCRCCGR
ncbi:MAG: MerC domain-containing protein [Fimbriimonadaceae bacterium]|nr:MerC domain-containing protein [Fimbriimonadaceae bacterium]